MNILTLIKSAGVRNFAKLLSANVVAQVIGLIVYPILTRIYSPEDFGLLNLFLSIGGVLTILSTAEYYYAIVLPKERKDAVSVLCVGLILLLVVGVLIGCSVFFLDSISMLLKSPLLKSYYWMMPIYVCLMGGWNLLNYWYIRNSEYSRISGYQISQSVLSAGGKIGLGYAGVLQGGMIYSVVFAPLISLLFNLGVRRYNAKSEQRIYKFQISWSDIFQKAKEFKNFPLLVLPRSVVNVLVGQMPILLLTPFFGSKMVGLYSLALLLGYTPIGTITRAVYQVLYQQTMKRVHQTKCIGSIIKRFIIGSSLIIIPLFLIASFILPELTGWLFGEEWYFSGMLVCWMLPWLYVSLLSCSINYLFDVFMKQKCGLYFEILLAIFRMIGLVLGIVANDFVVAIAAYSIGTTIALLIQLIWMILLVRQYDRTIGE